MPRHPRRAAAERLLEGPPLPYSAAYLWEWFWDIRSLIGGAPMGGLAPITWPDLTAWEHHMGLHVSVDERHILTRMDGLLRNPPSEPPEWEDECQDAE
jgi:hypothetical protein